MSGPGVLVVGPGMTLSDVVRASTARVAVPSCLVADETYLQPRGLHAVRLRHARHGLDLPAGRFSVAVFRAGVARGVLTTVVPEAVAFDDAVEVTRGLARALLDASWAVQDVVGARGIEARLGEGAACVASAWAAARWSLVVRVKGLGGGFVVEVEAGEEA